MDNLIEKYKALDIEQKRNQINIELKIIGELIKQTEQGCNINSDLIIKNYDSSKSDKFSEDEMLTFLYEDIFNIERHLITLLSVISRKP